MEQRQQRKRIGLIRRIHRRFFREPHWLTWASWYGGLAWQTSLSSAHHFILALQRVTRLVAIGFVLILASHFQKDAEERAWLRDSGSAIVGVAFARWLRDQGKARRNENGQLLRRQTMRINAEDVEEIRHRIEKLHAREHDDA